MDSTKVVSSELIKGLISKAELTPRKRTHLQLHEGGAGNPIQRVLNAVIPGSFIAPHCHPEQGKWEWLNILYGRIVVLIFDNDGRVIMRKVLAPNEECAIEIAGHQWHTVAALEPSLFFELKPGPFVFEKDKRFLESTPIEGDPSASACEEWYHNAQVGERFTEKKI